MVERLAQQARDARQRLQVIGTGVLGRQQQEDQVDRLVVERLEVDRLLQPREQADDVAAAPRCARAEWQCRGQRPSSPAARVAAASRRYRVPRGRSVQPPSARASCSACFLFLALRDGKNRFRRQQITEIHCSSLQADCVCPKPQRVHAPSVPSPAAHPRSGLMRLRYASCGRIPVPALSDTAWISPDPESSRRRHLAAWAGTPRPPSMLPARLRICLRIPRPRAQHCHCKMTGLTVPTRPREWLQNGRGP